MPSSICFQATGRAIGKPGRTRGDQARLECALKADEMLERGDADGQAVWLAIRRAAKSPIENGSPSDIDDA
jgi:hypothetical protein